ncbi:MAG: cytochrome P450 [Scytonema hyalinum WJT4-NPBG1]|nr:cytochrome P450 [Scytonema hyalinum WJT4-NPBG1]
MTKQDFLLPRVLLRHPQISVVGAVGRSPLLLPSSAFIPDEYSYFRSSAMVTVWMGSANRDETQFDRPDEFVVDRNPNPHLSFGNGIHFCLGAPLARLESKIVLSAVLERLPNLRIDPNATLEFIPSTGVYGIKSLPVLL